MAALVIKGRVWKFGDNISTDLIQPGFSLGKDAKEKSAFCMRSNRPDFAPNVKPGDVIVAGKNFGCGSTRPATGNLVALQLGGIIAESFSRIFFRNSIGFGFPLLYCPGVFEAFSEGDTLEADFETGVVKNLTTGKVLQADPLPEIAMSIIKGGGIIEMLRKEGQIASGIRGARNDREE